MLMGAMAKMKLRKFFSDEKGEVNIVAIVVLIGIAVVLALIFKEQIEGLLDTLFGTITEKANKQKREFYIQRLNRNSKLNGSEIVLRKSDAVYYVNECYEPGCMQRRNRILVDRCDYLLAYLKKDKGGTYYTVKYAEKQGKNIIYLKD